VYELFHTQKGLGLGVELFQHKKRAGGAYTDPLTSDRLRPAVGRPDLFDVTGTPGRGQRRYPICVTEMGTPLPYLNDRERPPLHPICITENRRVYPLGGAFKMSSFVR